MKVKNRTLGHFENYRQAKEKAETIRHSYKGYTMKIIRRPNGVYIANFSKYNIFEKLFKIVF